MANLDSILKSRDITLPTKICLVKALVFPGVMYGCEYTAHNGSYQLSTSNRKAQMLRLRIAHGQSVVPEISANRHLINIRFLLPDTSSGRPRLVQRDIGFDLTFCNL